MAAVFKGRMSESVAEARRLLAEEADAVSALVEKVDSSFEQAVKTLTECEGGIFISGLGKSGLIARKIAATLSSTGTPAHFIHPVEALHGDIGVISPGDALIAISHSGGNDELIRTAKMLRERDVRIISMTSNPESALAATSDVVLDLGVKKEACPLGLAPTTSTTATLAMGDAIAAALIVAKGFREEDFAMYHPAGALGRRLLMRVSEVMIASDSIAVVGPDVSVRQAVIAMTKRPHGALCVADEANNLLGILTDGDVRRLLLKERLEELLDQPVSQLMTKDPIRIEDSQLASYALGLMEDRPSQISVLPVVAEGSAQVVGLLRLHDLIKQGMK